MKMIQLRQISIHSFKGCDALSLKLDGQSAALYGDNAAGKTTVYDALTWLLFGKDSRGRGDFEIKPLGADGQVKDHGAVTEVEAVLDVGEEAIALRRTYAEKWSTKRGSSEASYDGNASEFYVDGVPVKKYEYERRVGELVSEELFRTLTGSAWFCEGLSWQRRREMLFDVCGVATDREVMEADPHFAPLLEGMGRLSLEDWKKKILAQRKGLNGVRNTVPARLDECRKTVEELRGVDFAALREKRSGVSAQVERLQSELVKLSHGALLDSKRNELAGLKNALSALANENERHRQSQIVPVEDRRPALRSALENARKEAARLSGLVEREAALIADTERSIQAAREEWTAENARTFEAALCPTCGQSLPQAAQEKARASFTADVARRKREIVAAADHDKRILAAAQARRAECAALAAEAEDESRRLERELAAYVPEEAPAVEDLPHFAERADALDRQIAAVQSEVSALEDESAAIREEITAKIAALRSELDELDRELGRESLLTYARERDEQLRREAQEAGEELEVLDKLLSLCDEFARHKAQYLEESINRRFHLVRFRLFQEQVNGGLSDCCEATVDGVPYGSLNNGARINAGLDVIGALSRHYGVSVSLFVDNAESVTALLPVETQVIRLVVSEQDKILRMEAEA